MGDDRYLDATISVRSMNDLMERADLDFLDFEDEARQKYIGRARLY